VPLHGENNNVHDHGSMASARYHPTSNRAQGDKSEIAAHTAEVKSNRISRRNAMQGRLSVIPSSQQGASGAQDDHLIGTITVNGNLVKASAIKVDNMAV